MSAAQAREVRTAAWCARIGLVDLGWIWTGNLRPLAAELALLTGYQFSDSDWIAIEYGVQQTDSEACQWVWYPVGRLLVTLALEPGADEAVINPHNAP